MGRIAVVADDAQHMIGVLGVAGEGPQLARHLGGGGIGNACHDRGQRPAKRTALVAVVAKAHVHQQTADVGIAQTQRAEIIGPLRDFLGRELRHHHRDFERNGPQTGGVHIVFDHELPVLQEGQQVHRRKVTGRVVEEHVFGTRVRPADRAVFGACVPVVYSVVILDTGIGAGPCGVADLLPQVTGADGFRHAPGGAVQQFPIGVFFDGVQESVGHPDRVVGVLARDRGIGFGIPVGVIGREFDRGMTLLSIIQHALDVCLWDRAFFRAADRGLQLVVLGGVISVGLCAVPCFDRGKQLVQLAFMHLRASDDARHLLLFDDLPVDEILDIGVVRINDNHLGRAPCGATRFDRACRTVTDFQKAHQARGFSPARQFLARRPQAREVGAGAGTVFEQTRLADPQVHNAAVPYQIVSDRLDETSVGLRMLVRRCRPRQLAGFVIDIVMPLRGTIDAVGPMQTSVEPLRAVGCAALAGQDVAHLVIIGLGVFFGGEIATFPTPIGPSAGQTVEHLLRRRLAAHGRVIGRHRTPEEFWHALFLDLLGLGRDACLAEIFLGDHIRGDLAPAGGHFDVIEAKDHRPVRIADFGGCAHKVQFCVGILTGSREFSLDFHKCCPKFSNSQPAA